MSNILLLDIETAPAQAYVWGLWNQNVSVDQIIKPSRITCLGMGFYGRKGVDFLAEWTVGREAMLRLTSEALAACDAVVTYNGDKFDIPRLYGEFAQHGIPTPGPVTSIDLYKTAKKMGFQSNKLAFVGPSLGIGEKVKHEGFRLWSGIENGDEKARRKMERYNIQDVKLLGTLYSKLRPFIATHPTLHNDSRQQCRACGSSKVQSRGVRRTRASIVERLHCQACGHWFPGKVTRV